MEGNRYIPKCGLSRSVVDILKYYDLKRFLDIDVTLYYNLKQQVINYSNWANFP